MLSLTRFLKISTITAGTATAAFGAALPSSAPPADPGTLKQVTIDDGTDASAPLQIRGADARQQLVVTGSYTTGCAARFHPAGPLRSLAGRRHFRG